MLFIWSIRHWISVREEELTVFELKQVWITSECNKFMPDVGSNIAVKFSIWNSKNISLPTRKFSLNHHFDQYTYRLIKLFKIIPLMIRKIEFMFKYFFFLNIHTYFFSINNSHHTKIRAISWNECKILAEDKRE